MFSSILFSENELNSLANETPSTHPYEYYKVKTEFLGQLQNQVQSEKRNLGIDSPFLRNLMTDYQQRQRTLAYKIIEDERYVPPNEFDTILGEDNKEDERRKKTENLREQYFQECVVKARNSDDDEDDEDPELMLTMPYHKRALNYEKFKKKNKMVKKLQEKYLGQEITSLFEKTETLLKKTSLSRTCKNVKIVGKMAPLLLNAYEVYFEEIFDALIDDILKEEVVFLNKLEELSSKNTDIINSAKNYYKENPKDHIPMFPSQLNVILEKLESYVDVD